MVAALLLAHAGGCERNDRRTPATSADSAASSAARSAAPLPSVRAAEHGETLCSEKDLGETFRGGRVIAEREIYSFPKMNAKLRKYPEFAAAAGLTVVGDCSDARRYSERYLEYSGAHPGFDAEGPTKEEQFRDFLSEPDNVAKPREGTR